VKTLHRHGFKVTANFPTGQSTTTENLQLREEAAKRDIHGNPIQLLGLEELYNMCGNHPLWREFLINRIEEQAKGGVDGILIDEPGDTAGLLLRLLHAGLQRLPGRTLFSRGTAAGSSG
jgi:hypothetical protein